MTVSDNTIQAKGLRSFFKKVGRYSAKAGIIIATNVLKNPGRALEVTSNLATTAAIKNPKAALSPNSEVITFVVLVKFFILVILFNFVPSKWNEKQKCYIPMLL